MPQAAMLRPMLVVVAMVGGLLAGCSDSAPAGSPPSASSAVARPPETAAVSVEPSLAEELGPRVELPGGVLLKQPGKLALVLCQGCTTPEEWRLRVVVTGVAVDPPCERTGPPPARGHRAVVAVQVETAPNYVPGTDPAIAYWMWSTVSASGVSEQPVNTLYACNESRELAGPLRSAAKYQGEITIDTANTAGRIVYGDGFAWDFPTA